MIYYFVLFSPFRAVDLIADFITNSYRYHAFDCVSLLM